MSELHNEYRVGDSTAYAGFCVALHGGAAIMVLLTDFVQGENWAAFVVAVFAWGTLAVAAFRELRLRGVWRSSWAITRIRITETSPGWRLCRRSGQWFGPADVIGGRVLSSSIWLHLRDQSGRREVLCIPSDSMSETMFRRLRVTAKRALGQ